MKSDSERQTAYQKRRAEKEVRLTFWMGKDMVEMCDRLRGSQSRSEWLHRAATELIYRNLAGKRLTDLYSKEDHRLATDRARHLNLNLTKKS